MNTCRYKTHNSGIYENKKSFNSAVPPPGISKTPGNSKRPINCKAAKREGHTDLIILNYTKV